MLQVSGLDGLFFEPVTQMQELPDLPAFVSVSELFLRLELCFAECVLRIPDDFTHGFEVLGHDLTPFAALISEIGASSRG